MENDNNTYTIAKCLAYLVNAYHARVNQDCQFLFEQKIEQFIKENLPSGSGIDAGIQIDLIKSKTNEIRLTFSYHFMNDNGYYDGWKDYKLTLKPCFLYDFNIKITGANRNNIMDYFYQTFNFVFDEKIGYQDFMRKYTLSQDEIRLYQSK